LKDITERVQAQESLQESEAHYRLLAENITDIIWTMDMNLRFTYVSPSVTRMLGYSVEEAMALTLEEVLPPASLEVVMKVFAEEMAVEEMEQKDLSRSLMMEVEYYCKDGSTICTEITVTGLRDPDGRLVEALGVTRDITERVRAEKALRESEEQYRGLFERVPVGLYRTTPGGQILDANPVTVQMLGYPNQETLLAVNVVELFVNPDDRGFEMGLLGDEEIMSSYELRMRRRDGVVIWVRDTFRAVRDAQGQILSLEGSLEDITERVRAAEALRYRQLQLSILNQMGAALAGTLELERIYRIAFEYIAQLVDCPNIGVSLYDPATRTLRADFMVSDGELIDAALFPPLVMGVETTQGRARAIATRQPEIIADYPAITKGVDILVVGASKENHTVNSAMYVPMVVRGQVTGLLEMQSYQLNAYKEEETALIGPVANQIGMTIENARLYEQAQQEIAKRVRAQESLLERTEELELLYEAGQQLSQTLDIDTIYDTFYKLVSRIMVCDSLAVSSFDPKEKLIHCVYIVIEGHQQDASRLPPLPLNPEDQGTQSVVIHTGKSLLIRDYQTRLQTSKKVFYMNEEGGVVDHNQAPDNAKVTRSAIVIPYKLQGLVAGVIQVMSYRLEAYSEADLSILESLASQIAVVSNNALLYQQTQRSYRELALLNRVIAAASTTLEPKAVLETPCRELALAFDVPQAAAVLLNEARTASLVVAEYLEEGYTSAMDMVIPLEGNPATQYVIEHKAPLAVADVQHDPRMATIHDLMRQRGTVSMLLLPLIVRGQVVGTLGLDAVERREFSSEEIDLAANAAASAAQALENARLFSQTNQQLNRMGALHAIDEVISASVDINMTVSMLLDQVLTHLEVDAADVLLFDPIMLTLECIGRKGFRTSALEHTHLRLGQGLAGQVGLQREIKHIPDLREDEEVFLASPELSGEGFVAYYGIPLIAKGVLKGVLEIFHRSTLSSDDEWLRFLHALASQAAIALDNAIMFADLQRSNLELSMAYNSTLEGWAKALELKDMETEGHSRRVTEITIRLASVMGIGGEALAHVRRGALLHDIGKMGIPDSILQKPGPLNDEEWVIMRQHPVYARDMLAPIAYLRRAIDIPYSHHEKWDGSGYPRGLRGEQIPLPARIFAIVDVWDALNSDRPYRDAWPKQKIIAHIQEQSGKHFDPRVVEAFLELIDAEGDK
ncbi:MAG: GAF domain-containing protein, partial [Chloroflexi bacterium]|nr:GAF domain-containing protein [Chloroflexota bacterium]